MIRLISYFLLVFLISWTIELPLVMNEQLGGSLFVFPMQHYISFLGPFLAAVFTVFIFRGFSGVKAFIVQSFVKGTSLFWYLFALGMPILFFILSLLIQKMFTGQGISYELPWMESLGIWLLGMVTFGIGEETGWRGFVLPELQLKFSPIVSACFITVIWALWYLPYFFEDARFMEMSLLMIAGWFVGLLASSLSLTWMFNKSGQNVWIPAFWQGIYQTVVHSNGMNSWILLLMTAMVTLFTVVVAIPGLKKKAKVG